MRHSRKLISAAAAAVSTAALVAVPTSANATTTTPHLEFFHGVVVDGPNEFDDPDACAAFGFTVHVIETDTTMYNFLFADDELVRGFAHHEQQVDFFANGKTIHESDQYNNTFAPDGTSVQMGDSTHIAGENGGLVSHDAGRVVFDADKNPTFIAGPHPNQFGGQTFCPGLMP